LVEMYVSGATMEISMEVHQEAKSRPTLWASYTTLGHIAEGI
jgi:hypothetical protein